MGVGPLSARAIHRRVKHARRLLYPLGLRVAERWASNLTDPQCERLAVMLGALAYAVLFPERRKAHVNLLRALGQSSVQRQGRQIVRNCFQNLALTGLECLRFRSLGPKGLLERIRIEGWEHVEAAHEAGRGGIFVTGHLGNWELCAAYVAIRGFPMNVVARRIYLEPLNRRLVEMRGALGVRTIYRDESMRAMIRCLRGNQFLGILPDQDVRRIGGIFVEFFGWPAHTPVGPALLALGSGSPILLGRDIRDGSQHQLTVDPPIYADPKAPREQEVRRLVTLYTQRLEMFIREHPDQWVWMHRRWRTQPQPTPRPSQAQSRVGGCSP